MVLTHPLAAQLQDCKSPKSIFDVFNGKSRTSISLNAKMKAVSLQRFLGRKILTALHIKLGCKVNPAYLGIVTAGFNLDGWRKTAPLTHVGLLSTIPWSGPIESVVLAAEISHTTSYFLREKHTVAVTVQGICTNYSGKTAKERR